MSTLLSEPELDRTAARELACAKPMVLLAVAALLEAGWAGLDAAAADILPSLLASATWWLMLLELLDVVGMASCCCSHDLIRNLRVGIYPQGKVASSGRFGLS